MANLIRIQRVPQCLSCIRRFTGFDLSESTNPFYQQVRGKKKTAKEPSTVKVRLLRNIPTYGRKGAIIPVAPGRMRNVWYPQKYAEYMTETHIREMDMRGTVFERDYTFGVKKVEEKSSNPKIEMNRLTPERAIELMSANIPAQLIFYRTPILTQEPEKPPAEPSETSASPAAADLAAASGPLPKPQPTVVYGSVSAADVAAAAKAALAKSEEGARVVLRAEDIVFFIREEDAELSSEPDRIKTLGEFGVEIRVRGGDAIRRTISVRAQEDKGDFL